MHRMSIQEYVIAVGNRFKTGIATEHSYRADLQALLSHYAPGCEVTNEPRRQACGAPDFIVAKKKVPVGFVEAKDIGLDLDKVEASEQLTRYRASLGNLVLTDYLEFRFYRQGAPMAAVRIAGVERGAIKALDANFPLLDSLLKEFSQYSGITISSPEKLAAMMADKARLMEEIILRALEAGGDEGEGLTSQYEAFKGILIHDLEHKTFADIYAQTIAYGLFAARLNDPCLDSFTRQEAGYLVPKTNPFIFQLFSYIAGPTLDDRIAWVVDDLAAVFQATDVQALLIDFGKETRTEDPFIHFYETFLAEYDPALRKARGVYYTPEPVVSFIVRSVDKILERDFGLPMGLADTSMTTVEVEKQGHAGKVKESVHRVQILDPACGTGTFLVQVLERIRARFEGQEGLWSSYVEEHFLPRLHGFEILMAPYAMCHLKLGMHLQATGYTPKNPNKPPRIGVYLTNALEEAHPDTGSLFANWLTQEATAANLVKRDAPVMVVLGNPPYANFGQMNKGEWIRGLIADYKKDLNEKKINLDDDYIKFIRYAEHYIEKNGHGIVAMITNNSYIDGITHRRMREHLMQTFDEIYVLDLHGSTKKKEVAPDGGKDENVFDIQQGVAIVFMVRKAGKSKKPAKVFHAELFGLREGKNHRLWKSDITTLKWKLFSPEEPNFFFIPKSISTISNSNFLLTDIFLEYNNGVKTDRDALFIDFQREELIKRLSKVLSNNYELGFVEKYNVKDSGSYKLTKRIVGKTYTPSFVSVYHYNPFDYRFIYYDPDLISRPARGISSAMLAGRNYGLVVGRQFSVIGTEKYDIVFLVNTLVDTNLFRRGGNAVSPLYLYPDSGELDSSSRRPNLKLEIVNDIAQRLGLSFVPDHEAPEAKTPTGRRPKGIFTPLDLLDYIYAVLHAPSYREKYRELLKIDFPRIPYPKVAESFLALAEKGAELRSLHLMESPELGEAAHALPRRWRQRGG